MVPTDEKLEDNTEESTEVKGKGHSARASLYVG